jgi:dethiobiotin synthetase
VGEIIFITGTDTGVGKTFLTALLLQDLRRKKIHALAMKPFCTGERADVEILQKLQPGELSESEMNPYFFPEPIAPFAAAKKRNKKIRLQEVVEKITRIQNRCDMLLVEGIGGLMVPLGDNFFVRDLIVELKAKVIVVGRNQLGTINHTVLTILSLKDCVDEQLAIVLMDPLKTDISSSSNGEILQSLLAPTKIFSMPFIRKTDTVSQRKVEVEKKIKKTLAAILRCV